MTPAERTRTKYIEPAREEGAYKPPSITSFFCGRPFIRFLGCQMPAGLAMFTVGLIMLLFGRVSGIFSLVAVIFLTAVMYAALHAGVRQGLISAALVVTFNGLTLFPLVERYSLTDPNLRRIVLLAVILPTLAYVVGRLHDRNQYLLEHEREARRKAEESERRLRFMAESMPQKIFTNTPDGKPLYSNPQWAEYTGLSKKEMERGDWTKLIHPDDVKENVSKWNHSIKTGEAFVYEHRLKRYDGAYRWHITRSHAMRDETGAVQMWVGSSTDIHDIKSALERERKLEKTTARLTEQREQLIALNQAKDEFISLASHQLRTPATGAKQFIGMVLEGYAGDITPEQQRFLQKAYESNERQITIVNDLLKVARVDAGKVTLQRDKTDVIVLIQSVLDEQNSKFEDREQTVLFQPKQAHLYASLDAVHIRMVLENIVDNASKYTPHNKAIEVMVQKTNGELRISVRDEGVGIDKKDVDKVFNKFSRIDNPLSVQVGGTGLGLYWAKKIIDLHGGSIEVESEIDKGTIFIIRLPL